MSDKVLFVSDAHYGLKSGGFDRTPEIHSVMRRIVDTAIDEGVRLFVHGGDLGHTANPPSYVHGLWIDLFERLERKQIESRFLLGNHDCVNREGKAFGSLAPLFELGFEYVKPVVTPSLEVINGVGGCLFIPYSSRANLPGKVTLDEFNNKFLKEQRAAIKSEPEPGVLAFTHLNITGAEINEDHILRPVSAVIPERLFKMNVAGIFAGHIHRPQVVRKKAPRVWVVGAPICTDFGDMLEKRFLMIDASPGGPIEVESRETGNTPLVQLEFDCLDNPTPDLSFDPEAIEGCGVKVKLRITEDQSRMIDLAEFQAELARHASFVRPIVPAIVRRDERNKPVVHSGMTDKEAVENFVDARKPTHKEAVLANAFDALENAGG